MPQNITDAATFTSPIVAPADGDPKNAASVLAGFQGLANRTNYFNLLRGAANGIAGLDGSARVPSVLVRNGIVSIQSFKNVGPLTTTYANRATASFASAGSATLTFANALAGDILVATCAFNALVDPSSTGGQYALSVTDGSAIACPETIQSTADGANPRGITLALRYTVVTAGPATLTCYLMLAGDGTHSAYVLAPISFVGTLYRP